MFKHVAGLLTYLCGGRLPKRKPCFTQWLCAGRNNETYSNGIVQDFHLIPF